MKSVEEKVLEALKLNKATKKRVTFFISEDIKAALAAWCEENGITESGAIEQLIKEMVPKKYFKRKE